MEEEHERLKEIKEDIDLMLEVTTSIAENKTNSLSDRGVAFYEGYLFAIRKVLKLFDGVD